MRSRQIVIEVFSHGVYVPNSADPAKMEHAKYVKIIGDLAEAIAKSGCYHHPVLVRCHGAIKENGNNEAFALYLESSRWKGVEAIEWNDKSGDVDSILQYCLQDGIESTDVLIVCPVRQSLYLKDLLRRTTIFGRKPIVVSIPYTYSRSDVKSWHITQWLKRCLSKLGLRKLISLVVNKIHHTTR